jgi:hypothetical protein
LIKTKYIPYYSLNKILCSYIAINEPKDLGVNLSIKIVFVGLFPEKTLNGSNFFAIADSKPCLSNSACTFVLIYHAVTLLFVQKLDINLSCLITVQGFHKTNKVGRNQFSPLMN